MFFNRQPKPNPQAILLVGGAILALGSLAWRLLSGRSRRPRPSLADWLPEKEDELKAQPDYNDVKLLPAALPFANKGRERPYPQEE